MILKEGQQGTINTHDGTFKFGTVVRIKAILNGSYMVVPVFCNHRAMLVLCLVASFKELSPLDLEESQQRAQNIIDYYELYFELCNKTSK